MKPDIAAVIAEIDTVLRECEQLSSHLTSENLIARFTIIESAIQRHAPVGSSYRRAADQYRKELPATLLGDGIQSRSGRQQLSAAIAGTLSALRLDYVAGRLAGLPALIHADLFSDFLGMAEYLLEEEKLKDPAAVLAGGVLEEHLRKLCDSHSIDTEFTDRSGKRGPKKLAAMNDELAKGGAVAKNDHKQINAWAGIRNDAAHGHFGNYQREQVVLMVQGIRDFIGRCPA